MSVIDIDKLLAEVSEQEPCGENLEYDPAFQAMDLAGQGKPEQQMGDTVIAAEDPNWSELRDKALEVLERSRDLRAVVQLGRALLHTDGMTGLSDCLTLTKGLLEQRWDSVHPQLDPEDDNDPTMRLNALASFGNQDTMVRVAREAPLVSSRGLGRFSLRDVLVASGKMDAPPGDDEPPNLATIDAAFMECDLDDLQATADAVNLSQETVRAIEGLLAERVGSGNVPELDGLVEVLQQARQVLAERLSRRGVVAGDAPADAAEAAAAPAAAAVAGEINSREDAMRMLDKISDFFGRTEPSSPVPLILQRAKRLISKNFMEIMRDMAPDGLSQARNITGLDEES
jgi:type VI secretion system protein ImpA